MKKYTFVLFLFILVGFSSIRIDYYNLGDAITATDTLDHEIQFRNIYGQNEQLIYIQTDPDNTGTIKFSSGYEMIYPNDSLVYNWGASSRIPLSIQNGRYNLHYRANTVGDIFVVTN